MKMVDRARALLVVGGSITALAHAQDTTISYSIKWDKPAISNGEINTGAVWAVISPGIGSSIQWTTPPGKGQPGKIMAFASSIFDTMNLLNGQNGQLSWTVPSEFSVAGLPGTPDGNGGIQASYSGQVAGGGGINPNPNINNPVKILELKWQAQAVGAYDVLFAVKSQSGKMFLDIGIPPTQIWVGHTATFRMDGQGGFAVIPAPTALSLLALGTLAACRRRR